MHVCMHACTHACRDVCIYWYVCTMFLPVLLCVHLYTRDSDIYKHCYSILFSPSSICTASVSHQTLPTFLNSQFQTGIHSQQFTQFSISIKLVKLNLASPNTELKENETLVAMYIGYLICPKAFLIAITVSLV